MSNTAKKIDQDFVSRQEFESLLESVRELSHKIEVGKAQKDRVSIVVFSGSLDKLIASFVIATGAAASGMEASLFFTFWGTSAFKKDYSVPTKKGLLEKMFGWMLPRGSKELPLSQMNMGGMGAKMIRYMMEKKDVASLEELIDLAGELGVRANICDMSMDLMGIKKEELRDYPDLGYCGVAKFLETSSEGKITLFI